MKQLKTLFIFLSVLSLGGCQTLDNFREDVNDITTGNFSTSALAGEQSEELLASKCPQVELVDDLSSLSDFSSPKSPTKANLISRVDLKSAESTCKLASKSAIVDLKLIFNGILGTKGRQKSSDKPFFSYPFFVAVTSPNGKIMAKEIFAASLAYGTDKNTHTYFEKLRQVIPIRSKQQAHRYKILIGFQVTPDQLAYNREHMVPIEGAKKKPEPVKAAN